jgi:thiamine-phosphate pyrophosphorylase
MKLPRLYPILDTALLARLGLDVETAAGTMLDGGARILQLRHKGAFSRDVFDAARRVAELCRERDAIFIIDDRADIAALLDAGLHVGQEDLPPADARRILGPNHVLGYSTHDAAQLSSGDREPVDYLAVGPIFATASKQNPGPVVGLDELARLRRLTAKPLVAIGGITRANARAVLAAGADSLAVIADLYPDPEGPADLQARIEQWQQTINE